jgi:CDP-glycerol glycerophosphotransferase
VIQETKKLYRGNKLLANFERVDARKTPRSIAFLYSVSANITNRYRIFAIIAHLRKLGWTCHAMDVKHAALDIIARAEFVSFCRLTLSTRTLDLVENIRATGGKVIFDTDDLLHDEVIFAQSEYFLRNRSAANRLGQLSRHTKELMALADAFTVTTPALLRSVEEFCRPSAIVDNSISAPFLQSYGESSRPVSDGRIHLSYLSGTATHSADFEECKAALSDLLSERSDVVLHIVGKLDVSDIVHSGSGQIQMYGLMSYAALHDFLQGMDINLAPLSDTAFNDAKSALKVFEAALHGVPTIASPSETYRNTIKHGETGYLARTKEEWAEALRDAVGQADVRQGIGAAARRDIVPKFSALVAAQQLSNFLDELAGA